MIYIGDKFDWNKEDNVPAYYLDNPNIERLKMYNLPVIDNVAVLFKSLNLSVANAKKFFYPTYRRTFLYREFDLPKKKGGSRVISVPIPELMTIQKAINSVILNSFKMSRYCTGFKKNMSLVDNAKPHLGAKTLLKFDIHDFFGSITYKKVFKQFKFYGYGNKVSELLTLLCVDYKDRLPQGAPTSPTLSNLVSLRMDKRIGEYCKKHNFIFTRYADDITISSKNRLSKQEINQIHFILKEILEDEGFSLNEKKTHCFYEGHKMKVTGVVINNNLMNPDKIILKEIDNAIYFIEKYGLKSHLERINNVKENYLNHLLGLISFVYMINPNIGKKYMERFNNIPKEKLE